MTPDKAIFVISAGSTFNGCGRCTSDELQEAKMLAYAALGKQTPRKPIRDSLADRSCPVCDAYIPFDALNDSLVDAPNFCKNCGQALDWRTDND